MLCTIFQFCFSVTGDLIPHITQICVRNISTGATFNHFVVPKVPIDEKAAEVTKINCHDGTVTHRGQIVPAVKLQELIQLLKSWLPDRCLLVGHNARRFDSRVLCAALCAVDGGLSVLDKIVGFVDSMRLFGPKLPPKSSLTQSHLVSTYLKKDYDAHNAEGDVVALCELLEYFKIEFKDYTKNSFSSMAPVHNEIFLREQKRNIRSLDPLVCSGVGHATCSTIAGSGLNLGHLTQIYQRKGEDGLRDVLSCPTEVGTPRVAKGKVLDKLMEKLVLYFKK